MIQESIPYPNFGDCVFQVSLSGYSKQLVLESDLFGGVQFSFEHYKDSFLVIGLKSDLIAKS